MIITNKKFLLKNIKYLYIENAIECETFFAKNIKKVSHFFDDIYTKFWKIIYGNICSKFLSFRCQINFSMITLK